MASGVPMGRPFSVSEPALQYLGSEVTDVYCAETRTGLVSPSSHPLPPTGGLPSSMPLKDSLVISSVYSTDISHKFAPAFSQTFNERHCVQVICCEGNAGFYEYGIMVTPLAAGYSVLGWNHPGFAGSTTVLPHEWKSVASPIVLVQGVPFPDQDTNAIDVVIQMAIHKLGFQPSNILLYAWSIGGYSATWAALNYPDISGLVLDATFDDILPLAKSRMPPVLSTCLGLFYS
ncbi:ABHD16A [Cordylochernes scorpioides]|uniref:ABHD16A n=1 Tax=Cordylochernes scorpioides TaxID=51811 RepID=A0ABY6K3H0_9ARAC|nr:ABHD16A [Cordylochernes scorpioides]